MCALKFNNSRMGSISKAVKEQMIVHTKEMKHGLPVHSVMHVSCLWHQGVLRLLSAANIFCWFCNKILHLQFATCCPCYSMCILNQLSLATIVHFLSPQITKHLWSLCRKLNRLIRGQDHVLLCSTAIRKDLGFGFPTQIPRWNVPGSSKWVLFVCLQVICGDCLLSVEFPAVSTVLLGCSSLAPRAAHRGTCSPSSCHISPLSCHQGLAGPYLGSQSFSLWANRVSCVAWVVTCHRRSRGVCDPPTTAPVLGPPTTVPVLNLPGWARLRAQNMNVWVMCRVLLSHSCSHKSLH